MYSFKIAAKLCDKGPTCESSRGQQDWYLCITFSLSLQGFRSTVISTIFKKKKLSEHNKNMLHV